MTLADVLGDVGDPHPLPDQLAVERVLAEEQVPDPAGDDLLVDDVEPVLVAMRAAAEVVAGDALVGLDGQHGLHQLRVRDRQRVAGVPPVGVGPEGLDRNVRRSSRRVPCHGRHPANAYRSIAASSSNTSPIPGRSGTVIRPPLGRSGSASRRSKLTMSCSMSNHSTVRQLATAADIWTWTSWCQWGATGREKTSAACATFIHSLTPPTTATSGCRMSAARRATRSRKSAPATSGSRRLLWGHRGIGCYLGVTRDVIGCEWLLEPPRVELFDRTTEADGLMAGVHHALFASRVTRP